MLTAVVVAGILLLAGSMLARMAWDAAASASDAEARVAATAAASSGASAAMSVARRVLTTQLPQNILDQGCKQAHYSSGGTAVCLVPGNDTHRTSGVRLERIIILSATSHLGWEQLQDSFQEVFLQVMPFARIRDAYRSEQVRGFGGLTLEGRVSGVPWRAYLMITPIRDRPINYNFSTMVATVPFEIRTYGWAYTDARTGRRVTAQVTGWSTNGTVVMRYRQNCTGDDRVCMYPEDVQVTVQAPSWLHDDPAVRWGF